MTDGVSNEPVIASTPTPISVEPRVPVGEAAEVSRQSEEARVAANAAGKEKPVEAKKDEPAKPRSIREAIRAAEVKINAEPNAAKPISVAAKDTLVADAKSTEPVVKASETPAKPDAKAAEPAPAKDAPARAEDGKFVSTKPAVEVAKVADAPKAAEPAEPAAAKPSHTAEAPPARFSAAAKEKWAEAPDEVRAEVTRAVTELTKGFEKHRTAAERDAGLNEFHEMAGKSGKALKDVVSQYVGMETLLRTDTIKGLELICQNAGLSLKDVAAKVLSQTPDAAASQQDATIRELRKELAEVKQGLGSLTQERQAAATNTTTASVEKFAVENPRFNELADDIAGFLTPVRNERGEIVKPARTKDLAEAYKLAERLNPAPAPAPQAEPASSAIPARTVPTLVPTPASTAGEKSIAGTPTAGSDPVRKQPSNSIRDALRKAKAAAG